MNIDDKDRERLTELAGLEKIHGMGTDGVTSALCALSRAVLALDDEQTGVGAGRPLPGPIDLRTRRPTVAEGAPPTGLLRFRHLNWHGDDHEYLVRPESIEWTRLPTGVIAREPSEREQHHPMHWAWAMHATVIKRDGELVLPTHRRSFPMNDLRGLLEIAP